MEGSRGVAAGKCSGALLPARSPLPVQTIVTWICLLVLIHLGQRSANFRPLRARARLRSSVFSVASASASGAAPAPTALPSGFPPGVWERPSPLDGMWASAAASSAAHVRRGLSPTGSPLPPALASWLRRAPGLDALEGGGGVDPGTWLSRWSAEVVAEAALPAPDPTPRLHSAVAPSSPSFRRRPGTHAALGGFGCSNGCPQVGPPRRAAGPPAFGPRVVLGCARAAVAASRRERRGSGVACPAVPLRGPGHLLRPKRPDLHLGTG